MSKSSIKKTFVMCCVFVLFGCSSYQTDNYELAKQHVNNKAYLEAEALLIPLSQTNFIPAINLLGDMYENHQWNSIEKNRHKAITELWKRSAQLGDVTGQYNYAFALMLSDKLDESIIWFKKAQLQGSIKAEYYLATLLLKKSECEQQGYEHLVNAARNGDNYANHALAMIYLGEKKYPSLNVKENKNKGLSILIQLASNGEVSSQYDLAKYYEKNRMYNQAIYWYEKVNIKSSVAVRDKLAYLKASDYNNIFLIQDEKLLLLSDRKPLTYINRSSFSVVYYQEKEFAPAMQISLTDDINIFNMIKVGEPVTNTVVYSPGSGIASGSGGYKTAYISNYGHHYLYYDETENSRAKLVRNLNDGMLELEFNVNAFYLDGGEYPINRLPLDQLYLSVFHDENKNQIIDEGELKKLTINFL
ncbi:hypothetical protein PVK62_00075 [Aliivibrio sp. S3MY1]|uniref:tetratricopeptide repeat protein n=1 Tax=unclassified Aliivibrio TaxID=2645654 RepID=UPI002377E552|nr:MULTISPECIES: hypothetical protein [unclassified Aliivibrio]MDD9194232.1 hypothetical protein [Aliivibrio sp. S3MY1]MDD9197899.1 hypothetical protein [Aliivibrio sp. S2MY1]